MGENRQTSSFEIKKYMYKHDSKFILSKILKTCNGTCLVPNDMQAWQGQHQSKRIQCIFPTLNLIFFFVEKVLLITFNESSELLSVFAFTDSPTSFFGSDIVKNTIIFRKFWTFLIKDKLQTT